MTSGDILLDESAAELKAGQRFVGSPRRGQALPLVSSPRLAKRMESCLSLR
jgi:hypothetical protein